MQTQSQTPIRHVIEEFMASLPTRDWDRMTRTLAANVTREGPEGPDGDSLAGPEHYIRWLSGMADPLHEYGWHTDRIIYADTGKSAMVEATTRYLLTEDSEPFGYHLVMVFDIDDDNLISNVDLYWKTPAKRLDGDTVSAGR